MGPHPRLPGGASVAGLLVLAAPVLLPPPTTASDCTDYAENPEEALLGALEIVGDPVDIVAHNGVVFLAVDGDDGALPTMVAVDVADPASPVLLDTELSPSGHGQLALSDQMLIAVNPSVARFDVSDPASIEPAGVLDPAELPDQNARSVHVDGDLAYVTTANQKLLVVDVGGDPTILSVLHVGPASSLNDVTARGGYVYLVGSGGLFVVDARVPTDPVLVDTISLANQGSQIELLGTVAIVSVFGQPSATFDLTVPDAPALVGSGPSLATFTVDGELLYAIESQGLTVHDYRDPRNPQEIGSLQFFFSFGVAIDGCLAVGFNPFFPPEELRVFPAHDAAVVAVNDPAGGATRIRGVPNPFRSPGRVTWERVPAGPVLVHDAAGRVVRRLDVDRSGSGSVRWDGRDDAGRRLSPGTYFVRIAAIGASTRVTLLE